MNQTDAASIVFDAVDNGEPSFAEWGPEDLREACQVVWDTGMTAVLPGRYGRFVVNVLTEDDDDD